MLNIFNYIIQTEPEESNKDKKKTAVKPNDELLDGKNGDNVADKTMSDTKDKNDQSQDVVEAAFDAVQGFFQEAMKGENKHLHFFLYIEGTPK